MQTRARARARRSVATIVRRGHDDEGVDEALLAWALLAASGATVLVTYSRVPADELYHVTGSGLAGGASRALVYANFPVALAAIPIAAIAAARLATAWAEVLGLVAIALCAAVFWPDVVDQRDLDARTVNTLPALGAALALGLTLAAARRRGLGGWGRLPGDGVRLLAAALLLLLAVPWIAADVGFHFDGVPVLGSIWQTGELRAPPGVPPLVPAVHLGHHHGLDGVLLSLTALALSRLRLGRPAVPVSLYLALMLAYGFGNVANDFWLEQVVKRGWTSWQIPSVLNPRLSWAWLTIIAGAALLWLLALRPTANPRRPVSRSLR